MKRFGKYIYVLILIFYSAFLHAQVKITDGAVLTMDNNSLLELESTNKGLLIPRISINDLNNASPLTAPIPEGMMVYSNGGTVNNGFYYWTGSKWANFTTGISIPSGTTNYAAYWSDAQTIAAEQYLNITRGGTGIGTAPTDGQLLIGNGLGYTLANISGTLNRLSVSNGAGSIALDIDANYIGQASITTLGTITSGIWNSTPIGLAYGGTNTDLSASAAVGDILFANTATSFARLADVALGNVLLSGGVGAAPSWGKINLTSHISGVLPIINGGTNSSTVLNNNRIMVSSGDAIIEAPALVDGQLLIGSTAALPVASTLTGTLNQVNITNGAGTITLSAPQDIHIGASPTFAGLNLSGLTASSGIYTDASKNLTNTPPASGTLGYWSRTGTILSPANAGDEITTSGNISTSGIGTITSAGLLTASKGFTAIGADISLNESSNFNTNINTGTSTGTVNIGNSLSGIININSGSAVNITTGNATNVTTTLGTTGSNVIASSTTGSDIIAIQPQSSSTTDANIGTLTSENLTATQTWTLPNASGTLATTGVLVDVKILTTTGTYTPTTGTKSLLVYVVGGGGQGGGCPNTNGSSGAGGGAGGCAIALVTWDGSSTYSFTVGAAGSGAANGTSGNPGGNSTFTNGATTYTANGGGGGNVGNGTNFLIVAGGIGGSATNGDINIKGENGLSGVRLANNQASGLTGNGGSSPFGSGGIGAVGVAGNGGAATGYGSGGGGALGNNANLAGGAGSSGVIIIYEYK
ncbi:MAG TPA: hypothetical protein PKZ43_02990 [Bacteroidales bacterium]|nr:hypothetical protein [Bacteroidales bacterium]